MIDAVLVIQWMASGPSLYLASPRGVLMNTASRISGQARVSLCLGLISTFLGILAVVSRFYPLLLLIALTAAAAIGLGVSSKRRIRASGGALLGSGSAVSGIVLSVAGPILGFLLMPVT
jgi:hypothetical protein